MMPSLPANLPDKHSLDALRAWDPPRICTALEIVAPARRAIGFPRRPLVACFPEMKPVVAFARTAMIRSREPHPRDRESANRIRLGYYEHIAAEPLPSLAVIQDIDAPDTGFGAFWGEVQTHVHKGLGCTGVITDGSVRDLDAMASGFFVLAGSIMPDRKSTRLNSSHLVISYAVFCLKKKKNINNLQTVLHEVYLFSVLSELI